MGMIPGTFIVKENLDNIEGLQKELEELPEPLKSSCGGSCGSPTCGTAGSAGCGCGGGRR